MANIITLTRVLLALIAILMLKSGPEENLIGTLLIIIALLLDAVDGYIARYFNKTSLSGGVYDILADRIIENLFFIYFASQTLFSIWIAFIFVIRGLSIDAVRSIFSFTDKTAFGSTTLHTANWAKFLTCSRISRGTYNALKLITFVLFAQLLEPSSYALSIASEGTLQALATLSLWLTLTIALLRAYPVIYEAFAIKLP